MNKSQAIDCLRVAVQATLLVCPQHEYRVWAQKYLQQTEPTTNVGQLEDQANDAIANLEGWQPWTGPGRARECWFAVRRVCRGLARFADSDWHNAGLESASIVEICIEINRRSDGHLQESRKLIEYCEIMGGCDET